MSYEVILAISGKLKAASLTAAEIRIDFAVLPETKCQGLFNQVHKIFMDSTGRAGELFPGPSLRPLAAHIC
ncbi:hypothetical protein [Monoglobus pectinilyticus]|uniref:hypothetical protein n=1 Tax=Monoglobus pectinilyticus TaxID=1981510 RepID=UPI002A75E756|nr:hypothetical protein [Monoglobus pectinilyticus]